MNNTIQTLKQLFVQYFKTEALEVKALPQSGSDRIYYRLTNNETSAIGAYNAVLKENEAFFSFTDTFHQNGCNVPKILAIAPDKLHYLLSDLGNNNLYQILQLNPNNSDNLCLIKKSLKQLLKIQTIGQHIDYSKCYPRESFDRQSIMWDLNYFKYNFLKLANIDFDEQALENDFNALADFLLEAPANYFMHRDFQSRNIMIVDEEPWIIDYQGGRRGPLQYDVASLLYSPKTKLNKPQHEALLDFYTSLISKDIDKAQFVHYYYDFVLVRILQAMGAYGFRGLYEKKPNFKTSIPLAIENLSDIFDNKKLEIDLNELERIVKKLSQSEWAKPFILPKNQLTISIQSFSYKKGVPNDPSENGGGFVFDCRGLSNPGRLPEYRSFTGLDKIVIDYLEQYPEVEKFQKNVREIVSISIEEYLKRGFNHLFVAFGCTGGQHRSVYNAQNFSEWIKNNYPVNVFLTHNEKNNWPKDGKKSM
ncbi:MAG TPA: RNase adapter RapZ [Prolixibacteraceae bacterium]|nr:RNase adapter RapZ [Prolixibacteraceae bacterium]